MPSLHASHERHNIHTFAGAAGTKGSCIQSQVSVFTSEKYELQCLLSDVMTSVTVATDRLYVWRNSFSSVQTSEPNMLQFHRKTNMIVIVFTVMNIIEIIRALRVKRELLLRIQKCEVIGYLIDIYHYQLLSLHYKSHMKVITLLS